MAMPAAPSAAVDFSYDPIPARAGVGLKPHHYHDILEGRPDIGWFEVHAENYMGAGGPPHHYLSRIRKRYPVSIHGVGLSIGGAGPLDKAHLQRLRTLVDRYQPALFSEHLAWSTHGDTYLNDLLPLPYTEATLDLVADHVDEVQEAIGRQMLIENPSSYVRLGESDRSETDFLAELVQRTGCGLLLDVNNIVVSATNHGYDADAYIDAFPVAHIGEMHLAGHAPFLDDDGAPLLVDAHDRKVIERVWDLYRRAIARAGAKPTLIEWDNNVPAWGELFAEARLADRIMGERLSNHAPTR